MAGSALIAASRRSASVWTGVDGGGGEELVEGGGVGGALSLGSGCVTGVLSLGSGAVTTLGSGAVILGSGTDTRGSEGMRFGSGDCGFGSSAEVRGPNENPPASEKENQGT